MRSELQIFRGSDRPASSHYQILVLSGGGYRGLFTAKIIEQLEDRAQRPAKEIFDLIVGTSIGGVIACGLACGISANKIRSAIETEGTKIFVPENIIARLPLGWIFTNRYSPSGLRNTIQKVLGEFATIPISELKTPLMVVAVSRADATPVIFESEAAEPPDPCQVKLIDVAMSTSAAPTYFPEHRVGMRNMVDGGIIANSADTLALIRALGRFRRSPDQIRMVSIGTAAEKTGDTNRAATGYGAVRWFTARRLFRVTTAAQERLSIQLAREVLEDRHIRIDATPGAAQQAALGLDITNKLATRVLLELAEQALRQLPPSSQNLLDAILRRRVT